MSDKASRAASGVLESGYIGQGLKVDQFEKLLSKRLNHEHLLTTNSGTSAAHLALHLLKKPDLLQWKEYPVMTEDDWPGLKDGDEVLCTPLTCTATNWPVLANGLKIKWVDIDPDNLNMDLEDLSKKITEKTKAIIVVHWGGYPVDLDKLSKICGEAKRRIGFRPMVIEDCAHSFGSTYKNASVGTRNIGFYSFQAIKHLTSVDGGALCVPYEKLLSRGKLIRWYGIDRDSPRRDFRCEEDITEWGFKFHMNDVNASIGIENLKEVDKEVITKNIEIAKYYNENLSGVSGVTLLEAKPDRKSSYWLYTIKVENRDDFMRMMETRGVAVSRVHERNDKHSCVKEFSATLPNLEDTVQKMICIPAGWWVAQEDREYIIESIKGGW